ncbi:MAG TPA: DUF5916 domain-containing protein [Vicinamibacterales bacterium]|nr:DUF5916 domain-containing protein [Vicinamibacterales bacterium]
MRVALLLLGVLVASSAWAQPSAGITAPASAKTYDGRSGSLEVEPPRIEQSIDIDGALDEAVWSQAAVLSGFSRYAPVDGAPADNATEVLVWYSPSAMHFGIRASAPAGSVRATLADRDRIQSDDHIIIFLSTYNDGRQAMVFGVNPLGVQLDGALAEGTRGTGGGFTGLTSGRESPDLSPDYVFQSKGRVTASGYEVEVRIPFKSVRYQSQSTQDWGIHVTRVVPQQGIEDSWAPARRNEASFLSQAGRLKNLSDLRRGLVLDLNPVATTKLDGQEGSADGWNYDPSRPEVGMNLRWGITPNLTMNGTVNPDFSQVEADASQFSFDPRQALFFPEKRPFFLDGIEQFATPNNLIYTRRVASPIAATKITGKVGGRTSLAYLAAVDDQALSATGEDYPIFNILRVQRDVGARSRAALVYTDRIDGNRSNRVIGSDARLVWKDIYSLTLQGAMSRTDAGETVTTAPLWQGVFARAGRRFALRYTLRGVDPDFRAAAGFISRTGIASGNFNHALITYGKPGSALERWSSDVVLDGTWQYDELMAGRASQDRKLHFNNNFTFRGGWRVGGSVLFETFGYDKTLYRDYFLGREGTNGLEFVPYPDGPRLPNLDYVFSATTPQRAGVELDAQILWGKDENFYEWSSADIIFLNVGAAWKPTDKLRVDARYQLQSFRRRTDDSIVGIRRIPRLKAEYQISRPIFVRVIGEYNSDWQDDLRDDSRTNLPIYILNRATGQYDRAAKAYVKSFRTDFLFSYQPTPGTLLFAGYGNTLADLDDDYRTRKLQRSADGFFLKFSYLFRL